jgi:hypothetical protein
MPTYPTEQARKIVAEGLPIGPRMDPCLCGAPRAIHGGAAGKGRCVETGCVRYRVDRAYDLAYTALAGQAASVNDAMKEWESRERAAMRVRRPKLDGQWSIGASDAGRCRKQIGYRENPPDDYTPLIEDKRAARMGGIIDDEITRRYQVLYPWRLHQHWVTIEGLDRESRLDMFDPVTGRLTDLKTSGQRSWERVGLNGPYEEAWKQVDLYALGMEDEGHTVTEVAITYVNRDNGHDETYVRKHDRARGETVRQELLGVATALDLGMPLPRDGNGPETDWRCRLCPARAHCWNLDAAQVAGRSGESFTILGAEPDDESIIWAAETYVDARQLRLDAAKHEKESRVLLEGIDPGEYGEFIAVSKPSGGKPNYMGTVERLRELIDLPDGERPAADSIETLRYVKGQTVEWKRKRAATRERKARDANVATDAGAA